MKVDVVIATFGDAAWAERARGAAWDSAVRQYPAPSSLVAIHAAEGGLHDARNAGARARRGEHGDWLCFLDADDELAPGYLAAMGAAAAELDATDRALLVPAVARFRDGQWIEGPLIPNADRPMPEMNRAVIGTLVQRAVFEEVGGFRDWPMFEDWDLWLRCMKAGAELVHVEDAVYIEHVSEGRNSVRGRERKRVFHAIRKDLGYE